MSHDRRRRHGPDRSGRSCGPIVFLPAEVPPRPFDQPPVPGVDVEDIAPGAATRRAHALTGIAVLEARDRAELRDAHAWTLEHLPPETPSTLLHGDLLGQNILLALDGPPHVNRPGIRGSRRSRARPRDRHPRRPAAVPDRSRARAPARRLPRAPRPIIAPHERSLAWDEVIDRLSEQASMPSSPDKNDLPTADLDAALCDCESRMTLDSETCFSTCRRTLEIRGPPGGARAAGPLLRDSHGDNEDRRGRTGMVDR